MRFLVWSNVVVISGLLVMLSGCTVSSDASNLSVAQSPQLPESYPCQNLHVKAMSCPPG
ncbi:hypothetical protein ABH944_002214 [Caballeronia udeis]|uniref:Lipoprotein n=1 Tax=Caballeronia udeis TaxID=1232866 RepID=A0ABW8MFU2_9BURK